MDDNSGAPSQRGRGRPREKGRKAPLIGIPPNAISSSQRPAYKRARSADAAAPSRGVDEVHAPSSPTLLGPCSRGGAVGQPAATASVAAGTGGIHLGAQGGGIDFEPGPARDVRFIVPMDDGPSLTVTTATTAGRTPSMKQRRAAAAQRPTQRASILRGVTATNWSRTRRSANGATRTAFTLAMTRILLGRSTTTMAARPCARSRTTRWRMGRHQQQWQQGAPP